MSLISWNPFREMDNVGRDMESFFERSPFGFFSKTTSPRVDVFETEKNVVVKAEIPGVSKEDLNVYVDENYVKLSGQTKRDSEYKDENVYRSERYYGSFSRTIPLPVEVKSEQAKAEYKDGILSITVPKVESTQLKGKKIDIQ
ncbi:MAG TPA: Hsp20/alpha crystallin family protein [Acetivibrio sp.]|uniref:Hsp20/alpha crystallin family protein n=1 Tax=Acetivibrio sp. TaxID=1872092 RepID=UPI002BFD7F71|nr:Hsp20/alpha crystallin family protein [Acetivibrio sp.]HOM02435.1 Hsp20/alpha crystallin family protein [Acetivibrio sp.]